VGRVADDFDLIGAQRVVFNSALRPSERLILLAVLDHWSPESRNPFPGIALLRKKTGLARQTVLDAVDSLVVSGVLPEPGKLGENGQRRSGCRFVYDIEKAVHNLDRLNPSNRYTNKTGRKSTPRKPKGSVRPATGKNPNRSSSGEKPVYPGEESSPKKAAVLPKEPTEGTNSPDADQPPGSDELAEMNFPAWEQTQELRRLERQAH
jgi:hypothetical protein